MVVYCSVDIVAITLPRKQVKNEQRKTKKVSIVKSTNLKKFISMADVKRKRFTKEWLTCLGLAKLFFHVIRVFDPPFNTSQSLVVRAQCAQWQTKLTKNR